MDGSQRQLTATAMAGGSVAIDGAAVAINSGNGASGSGGGGKQAGFVTGRDKRDRVSYGTTYSSIFYFLSKKVHTKPLHNDSQPHRVHPPFPVHLVGTRVWLEPQLERPQVSPPFLHSTALAAHKVGCSTHV